MTRVGIVEMWHETNTYAARATTLTNFSDYELLSGDELVERYAGTRTVIGGFLEGTRFEMVPVFSAGAWPGGTVAESTADELLERLGDHLTAVESLDGILVNLHGAMVADGHPDMEMDTLEVIRQAVGEVPIACVLDFHANPSVELVEAATVVLSYDTYPHVDMFERGMEAAGLLGDVIGGLPLETRIGKYPLLSTPLAQGTDDEPMMSLIRRARTTAARLGVERICITGGFPYSDVERAGTSVLVTGSSRQRRASDQVIATVLEDIEATAPEFAIERDDPVTAVTRALEAPKPVVLADVADNIGGGAPGDGTVLLAELLDRGAVGVIAVIADGDVAVEAHRVGVAGTVAGPIGGKTDDRHGSPVDISGRVRALSDGRYHSGGSWGTGQEFSMGRTALLEVEGIDMVVTERPTPPFHVEQVTHLGLDPASASIIIAKGTVAWRSAYGDVARTVIEVDTPGICPIDLSTLPRTTKPIRHP